MKTAHSGVFTLKLLLLKKVLFITTLINLQLHTETNQQHLSSRTEITEKTHLQIASNITRKGEKTLLESAKT